MVNSNGVFCCFGVSRGSVWRCG